MDIYFSEKEGHVFLTAIIDSYCKQHRSGFLGRTYIQKIPYFVKCTGVPLPFRYEILHYGPYSSDVSSYIDELEADGIIEDVSRDKTGYSNYKITKKGKELLKNKEGLVCRYKETIDIVVKALGEMKLSNLELISTIHFLFQEQKFIGGSNLKSRVLEKFGIVKKGKFSPEDVSKTYDMLEEVGLLRA